VENGDTGVDKLSTVEKFDSADNLGPLVLDCPDPDDASGDIIGLEELCLVDSERMTVLNLRFVGGRAASRLGDADA
jgi:hypothetical protein